MSFPVLLSRYGKITEKKQAGNPFKTLTEPVAEGTITDSSIFDGGALILLILSAGYLGFWLGRANRPVWGFDFASDDDGRSYAARAAGAGEAWQLMKEGGEGRVSVYQGRFRMGSFLLAFSLFFFCAHPVLFPGSDDFRIVPMLLSGAFFLFSLGMMAESYAELRHYLIACSLTQTEGR